MAGLCEGGNEPPGFLKAKWVKILLKLIRKRKRNLLGHRLLPTEGSTVWDGEREKSSVQKKISNDKIQTMNRTMRRLKMKWKVGKIEECWDDPLHAGHTEAYCAPRIYGMNEDEVYQPIGRILEHIKTLEKIKKTGSQVLSEKFTIKMGHTQGQENANSIMRTVQNIQRLEHIKTLEKIQTRALKCCRKNSPLKWDTLTDRRTRIRLCALFKTYRGVRKVAAAVTVLVIAVVVIGAAVGVVVSEVAVVVPVVIMIVGVISVVVSVEIVIVVVAVVAIVAVVEAGIVVTVVVAAAVTVVVIAVVVIGAAVGVVVSEVAVVVPVVIMIVGVISVVVSVEIVIVVVAVVAIVAVVEAGIVVTVVVAAAVTVVVIGAAVGVIVSEVAVVVPVVIMIVGIKGGQRDMKAYEEDKNDELDKGGKGCGEDRSRYSGEKRQEEGNGDNEKKTKQSAKDGKAEKRDNKKYQERKEKAMIRKERMRNTKEEIGDMRNNRW
ncbi:hypothetical protein ANN_01925 [Periplaneta americana]|uniref:Uncharacterized protein n=1 Tax=Periplaneta americana TaxID=6978 RepID=A0ABQ8TXB9_PERAM|nr:hypothetical protein ANN_01925 [Periplaneta americana]